MAKVFSVSLVQFCVGVRVLLPLYKFHLGPEYLGRIEGRVSCVTGGINYSGGD